MKAFLAVNVAIFALVGWNFIGEYMRGRELRLEIAAMERRATELETKNLQIAELGKKLSQGDMAEREARTKLNLQKPGEEVVIVRGVPGAEAARRSNGGDSGAADGQADLKAAEAGQIKDLTNPGKWWRYFFFHQDQLDT